jgi:hypothetical protein
MDKTQKIIERFAWQSFGIKGFSLTFLGLTANIFNLNSNIYMFIILLMSICLFWYLDSFYLKMERIYRKIEEIYVEENGLNYKNYDIHISIFGVLFSKTMWPVYVMQITFISCIFLQNICF